MAAACGSLQHIFEKPFPEKPTLLESLSSSWNQLKPVNPIHQSSLTEIFGELHFKETCSPSSSFPSSSSSFPISSFSSSSPFKDGSFDGSGTAKLNNNNDATKNQYTAGCSQKKGDGFSLKYESLQLCTEGLGFESSDDVEDLKRSISEDWQYKEERVSITKQHSVIQNNSLGGDFRKSPRSSSSGAFPPPISSIGKSGKPWVCFKSYRQDGRFVLKQVRIPTQELLHACRKDGRLKLHFIQPSEEITEEEEEEEEEEDEDDNEEKNYTEDDDDDDDDDDL